MAQANQAQFSPEIMHKTVSDENNSDLRVLPQNSVGAYQHNLQGNQDEHGQIPDRGGMQQEDDEFNQDQATGVTGAMLGIIQLP